MTQQIGNVVERPADLSAALLTAALGVGTVTAFDTRSTGCPGSGSIRGERGQGEAWIGSGVPSTSTTPLTYTASTSIDPGVTPMSADSRSTQPCAWCRKIVESANSRRPGPR